MRLVVPGEGAPVGAVDHPVEDVEQDEGAREHHPGYAVYVADAVDVVLT